MKKRDERKDIRTFGIGLAVILLAMGSYRFYYKEQYDIALWFFIAGGMALVLALLAPSVLKPLYKVVTAVAHKIGWVNTRVLLAVLYYLLFTPIAVVFRLFGRDPLDRKIEVSKDSYWVPRKQSPMDKKRYERQF